MPERWLDKEPDGSIIDRQFRRLSEIWTGAHRQWESYDQYYFRTYSIWTGREAHTRPGWLKPSRPTSIIDNAVDHQIASDPLFHRFPARQNDTSKQRSDQVEKAMKAIMDDAALEEPTLTWRQHGKNFVHLGYSIHELGLDSLLMQQRREEPVRLGGMSDDEWDAVQALHQHRLRTIQPFRTRTPHPSRILLDPWEKRPRVAIRHYRRFAQDIEDMCLGRQERGQRTEMFHVRNDPFEMILVDEYWTEKWHAMMVSGRVASSSGRDITFGQGNARRQMLFVDRNTWGFVPYAHGYAGFGQEPTVADHVDPKHFAVGLLDSVREDIRAQAQAIAGRHNALMEATFTKIGTNMGADEIRDMAEDDILELPDEGALWRIQGPSLQRWMFESTNFYDADMEQGTFSRAVSGHRERGVSTVGQQAILSQAAGRKFVAVARQMEHIASVAASQILQLVDLRDLDLTVRGNELNPGMIEKDYAITASFDLVDPVLDLQKRQLAMQEFDRGLKSMETYWGDAGLEDASGERKRLLLDWIRRNPFVHQTLAMELAREEGIESLLERALEMSRGQQGGQGNGNVFGELGGITGPDGQPLQQTLGSTATPELNQPLTGDVVNPDRAGNILAG